MLKELWTHFKRALEKIFNIPVLLDTICGWIFSNMSFTNTVYCNDITFFSVIAKLLIEVDKQIVTFF